MRSAGGSAESSPAPALSQEPSATRKPSVLMGRLGTLILLALAILSMGVRNLPWHLDDYDQAKQAYVSFEMVERGHWFLQHTPRQFIATKPPLMGWISAGLFYITHWWEGAWRLPSFAAALILLFLLKREGDIRFARPVGILVAAVFGMNILAPRVATLVRTDMLLTLLIFLAGWLMWRKLLTRTPWTRGEQWGFCGAVLAGVLVKGPVVYAFLLPGVVAFCLVRRRDWRVLWCGWWPWVIPMVVFLGWSGANIYLSREFYEQVVLKEFMGRFSTGEEAVHRPQPVYYYVLHLLVRFAPWSLLLVALLWSKRTRASEEEVADGKSGGRFLRFDAATVWLICWAFGALIFMSLVPSKRIDRVFPIIPVMALLTGALASRLLEQGGHWGRWKWSVRTWLRLCMWLALLASVGYTLGNAVEEYRRPANALAMFGERVRSLAEPGNLRIGVVANRHEGMLLYLRRPEYLTFTQASRAFRAEELDLLVLNRREYDQSPDRSRWEIVDKVDATVGQKATYYCVRKKAG